LTDGVSILPTVRGDKPRAPGGATLSRTDEGKPRKRGPDEGSREGQADRRKPARRRQRLEYGDGLLYTCASRSRGGICRWKALWIVKTASLDGGGVETVLAVWDELTRAGRTRWRQGASEVERRALREAETRHRRVAPVRSGALFLREMSNARLKLEGRRQPNLLPLPKTSQDV
jgi:hypothetical protein